MNVHRQPSEFAAPRMAALARLPVFFALAGKRVLLAGDNAAAAWKAELLSAAGARVDVCSPHPSDELLALARDAQHVRIAKRQWHDADFHQAILAVGAFESDEEAARFANAARKSGVPVNVVDRPAHCDFSFGAIVNRSPLVIGISTDGAAPVFGQAIRAKLEALIPRGFARWAEAAQQWRSRVQSLRLTFADRRRVWETFTERAIRDPNREPTDRDLEIIISQAIDEKAGRHSGSVVLVGAGPGDPELLTLRAVRALQSADIILFDDLVAPEILDFARREAKKMMVGKTGHKPSCKQDEINALMISLAKSGRRVVRLKGGDPMVFGRANEEIAACRKAGISVDIVPGISAAQAAASRLQVSLTDRSTSRRVHFITGYAAGGGLPADMDWKGLADSQSTLAVYMPVKTLAQLSEKLIAAGLAGSTPAIAISRATRTDEIVVWGTVSNLTERIADARLKSPVLVLIGLALQQATSKDASRTSSTLLAENLV